MTAANAAHPRRSLRIVVPRSGRDVVGGSEGLVRRLADALADRGWTIDIWTTTATDEATWKGNLPARERSANGVATTRFRVAIRRPPGVFHQLSRLFFRLPPLLRPELAWVRLQGPYTPDLVHALAHASRGPTLFTPYLYYPTLAGLPRAPHPRLLIPAAHDERPLRLRAVGRAIAAADGILYGTPEERALVEATHPAARAIPNAIGTTGLDTLPAGDGGRFRARHGVSGPLLLYGGRVAPGKGFDVLLRAYRLIRDRRPDIATVVAGDVDQLVPDGVMTVGRLGPADWADALDAATAVIVPSSMESLSLLALEAWAAGRPCIVNAASPVLAGQASRSGGALTFDSAQRLAEVALQVVDDPGLAARLGEAGRTFVRTAYRWDDVADRIGDLIAASTMART